ncbi:MAG: tRNA (N(6)-L-threonylcarbamoyladenosine(37)-C(2))-methylthiotransferase MtaB [Firmicutes bacterium]|nr:tRNA (N(6)-L-threonylcarbamoyladenosine(37)-C(2))-methylthiotransferase MtaB [Bacillota bacterium]
MKVAFHTLGCKVNQYETEAMKEQFLQAGYEIVEEEEPADIYIINTCTVTNLADRKSRQYIRRMKKQCPEAVVAVTGCYAQVRSEELTSMEEVDIVTGTGEKQTLLGYIEEFQKNRERQQHIRRYEELGTYEDQGIITSMESRTRAYIKIQEGCNRFCAYCLIPFARGQVRSRKPEEIVEEARTLINAGFKELILTGINTALYGTEDGFSWPKAQEEDDINGIQLIIKRINQLEGDFRIRLSSLEPTVIDADYVKRLLPYEKLCPHLHLSIQSGSNRILKLMNRHYDRQEYLQIVKTLKDFDPGYGITTDIIVGFPGETEEDFQDSLDMIERVGFCKVHGFRYSKRQGTAAADMKEQIDGQVKNQRIDRLLEAGERAAQTYFAGCAKRKEVRTVLFEEEEDGLITGYSETYVKVYAQGSRQDLNQFRKVKLLESYRDGMKGEILYE